MVAVNLTGWSLKIWSRFLRSLQTGLVSQYALVSGDRASSRWFASSSSSEWSSQLGVTMFDFVHQVPILSIVCYLPLIGGLVASSS